MQTVAGHCGRCGAPYFAPGVYHSVTAPPMTPSCSCWNQPTCITTTTTSGTDKFYTEAEWQGMERSKFRWDGVKNFPDGIRITGGE